MLWKFTAARWATERIKSRLIPRPRPNTSSTLLVLSKFRYRDCLEHGGIQDVQGFGKDAPPLTAVAASVNYVNT